MLWSSASLSTLIHCEDIEYAGIDMLVDAQTSSKCWVSDISCLSVKWRKEWISVTFCIPRWWVVHRHVTKALILRHILCCPNPPASFHPMLQIRNHSTSRFAYAMHYVIILFYTIGLSTRLYRYNCFPRVFFSTTIYYIFMLFNSTPKSLKNP